MRLGIRSNQIQLRVRLVRRLLAVAVAMLLAGFMVATMAPTTASAAALYCKKSNPTNATWEECVYHYYNSLGQNIIQGQSHDIGWGSVLGHTEIIGTQNCSGTAHKNSSDYVLTNGHIQRATLNFGFINSCHTHWCAIFWEVNNNGGYLNFFEECANFAG